MDEKWRTYHREYQRVYRKTHKETISLARRRQYRDANRRRRQRVLDLFGSRCVRCGCDDVRVLQVDHINGNGRKEVQGFSSRTKYLLHILAVNGIGYQLLCANCNLIKAWEQEEW
jgi:hypothetical protein